MRGSFDKGWPYGAGCERLMISVPEEEDRLALAISVDERLSVSIVTYCVCHIVNNQYIAFIHKALTLNWSHE